MRTISTCCAALALVAIGASLSPGAPAPPQDPFAGKSVDELIEAAKKRISERDADVASSVKWDDFSSDARKHFGPRLNRVAKVWKNTQGRFPLEPVIALGRIYRSYGDQRGAKKQFDRALGKANDGMTKRWCHLELARMYQLFDNDRAARAHLGKATAVLKNVNNQPEAAHIAEIGRKVREYKELLSGRAEDPRNWRKHWAVCQHLLGFRDTRGLHYLVLDTLVALEWLRVAFPDSPASRDGGVHWFMLEVATAAKDVETAIEVGTRYWELGEDKDRNKSGELALQMAAALRQDDSTRQQALRCYVWLQANRPNNPAVAQGQVSKDIQNLERQRGVRRETADSLPSPPWKP